MLLLECANFVCRAGDQRRRHEPAIIEHHHFFRRIADARRVVDYKRFALDALQQVCCGDIAHMERRVLPHQHDVDVGPKVDTLGLSKAVVRAFNALQIIYWMRPCTQPVVGVESKRTDIIMPDSITPRLRRQHQRKARIPRNVDTVHRVHLDCDCDAHILPLSMPDVDQMAGEPPRRNQYHVDADLVGAFVIFMDQRFRRRRNPAQAVGVYGSCEIGILHPRLDLDKGQRASSPGYQIDLPSRVAHPLTQYLPAVQPQPPRGDRLSTPAT